MATITGITPYGKAAFPTYEVADMAVEITYEKALLLALPCFNDFYDKHEWVKANNEGKDYYWHKFHENELTALASVCCYATDTVCDLFGVSDEQVHKDLFALREIGA